MKKVNKKKICFVVAIPGTAQAFLKDHIEALSKDYDVYLAADINNEKELEGLNLKGWHHVDIQRGISLKNDLKAVKQLASYFKKMKFDAVHSVTPKAGLVTALAGKLAGIKHRIHIFTGQVWATSHGVKRSLLKSIDKLISKLDNHILVDGHSQRTFLISEGVLKEGQSEVFCNGSISGVNSVRFTPNKEYRKAIRQQLNIPKDTTVFVFLGRLNRDKGISEIYEAFNALAQVNDKIFLLLIGTDEENYIEKLNDYSFIKEDVNFHFYGETPEPEKVLNAGDIYILPSYREGFGTSVLEAACMELPTICSDVYGILDSYIEGETGLKCKVKDSESLLRAMIQLLNNPEGAKTLGKNGRKRAITDFNSRNLSAAWVKFYRSILH